MTNKYLRGQRVIVSNTEIAIYLYTESDGRIWVRRQNGIDCWFSPDNIKPLPGGQL